MYIAEAGAGTKYAVRAEAVKCGKDVSAAVTGGTLSHVGAVSLAQYEPERDSATVSTAAAYTHRDGEISALFAKRIASALKCNAAVSAGIHIDGASQEELALLRKNASECLDRLIAALSD